jgi:hypothetical protein
MRMRVVVLRNFGLSCCQRALGTLLMCFVRYDSDQVDEIMLRGQNMFEDLEALTVS